MSPIESTSYHEVQGYVNLTGRDAEGRWGRDLKALLVRLAAPECRDPAG